jgi:hypothetical protein
MGVGLTGSVLLACIARGVAERGGTGSVLLECIPRRVAEILG